MNGIIKNNNGELMTTSKLVADYFGKAHRDVVRALDNIECSAEFRAANFAHSSYTSPQNKVLQCFNITKDGFYFLAMGFTGDKAAKFREGFIAEFKAMEKGLDNFDAKVTKLSLKGKGIEEMGKEWSRLGHSVNKQKKAHDKSALELIDKIQCKLDFTGEK